VTSSCTISGRRRCATLPAGLHRLAEDLSGVARVAVGEHALRGVDQRRSRRRNHAVFGDVVPRLTAFPMSHRAAVSTGGDDVPANSYQQRPAGAGGVRTKGISHDMAETLRYAVMLERDVIDGGFTVHIPAFPHAHTQGDDAEDALRNAREAIALEIDVLLERGEALPPSDGDASAVRYDPYAGPIASAGATIG
jgi:predicted RNase H-like HicB family nuclease